MRKLSYEQFEKMDLWMQNNARPYDKAKWNYLFNNGDKDNIVSELLKFQNKDGGFGNGFEPDLQSSLSTAISTAEAIFQTYDYDLDTDAPWFEKMLCYFENSVKSIPKYWEDFPKEAINDPCAPWWSYEENKTFSPNPCAVIASAFIRYGTKNQKDLGNKIAKRCFDFLKSDNFCGDHDSLNILTLIDQLMKIDSSFITKEIMSSMKRRISENTCFNPEKWNEYYFQPLDFVSSPRSVWYDDVKKGIEDNIEFWLDNINDQGVWQPNFSWGIDSNIAKQVTENWKGYITVKRAKILLAFDRIERKI